MMMMMMDGCVDGWMEKELLEDESRDGVHLRSPGAWAAFPVLSFPFQGFFGSTLHLPPCLAVGMRGGVGLNSTFRKFTSRPGQQKDEGELIKNKNKSRGKFKNQPKTCIRSGSPVSVAPDGPQLGGFAPLEPLKWDRNKRAKIRTKVPGREENPRTPGGP